MLGHVRGCAALLTPRQRRRWAALVPLAFATGALETLGTAAVFVLIKVAGDPSSVSRLGPLARLGDVLPAGDGRAVVVGVAALVCAFFLVRSALLVVASYLQSAAAEETIAELSQRLLRAYLVAPHALTSRRRTADLIHDVGTATGEAVRLGMASVVHVASEVLVIAGLAAVLLAAAPLATVVTAAFLAALMAATLGATRRRVARWGKRREELGREVLGSIQQSLGGLKEIRVLGREGFFLDAFARGVVALASVRGRHAALSDLPRHAIEALFMSGVLLVVALVTRREGGGADVVPILGLYAYAGFRLIPSANRIIMHANNVRYAGAAVDRIGRDLAALEGAAGPPTAVREIAFTREVLLDRVSYAYEGADHPALRDATLRIRRGESVGIVGATGSGKSTLVDLILGLIAPSSGRIAIDGVDLRDDAVASWQRRIGYVPQAPFIMADTIRRNIALGLEDAAIDGERLLAAVRLARLADVVAALPAGLDTFAGEQGARLSGGERQRVAIARALYRDPAVLVFDEATSALDNQTELEVTGAIEALKGEKTLLVVAHRLTTVRRCDRLVFLRDGRIEGSGSFDELLRSCPEFRAMATAAPPPAVTSGPATGPA